ncbi:HAD family hydrolase [Streptosporangium saharense]|uniref:HAD family hydrolase n=1 Tax=Streptosporangium saharense TaxID=1706840 RepID=UPI0034262808
MRHRAPLGLFDLDNTLIDLDAALHVWAEEFATERALTTEAVDWLIALDRSDLPHRETFFGKVRERFGLPDPVEELWAAYRRRMPHLVHCRPEVLTGLTELRATGWRVGIVTNGTADNQLGKIQRTGLAEVVDGYALSGIEGIRKPESELFKIAARRCGASLTGEGWMVGDHLTKDIAGGRAAGLRTIWVDRDTCSDQDHQADHVVTDVIDVIDAIAILREREKPRHETGAEDGRGQITR